jgi:hypothetical protein
MPATDKPPEPPLPRWFPAAFPVSIVVAVVWGAAYAAVFCGVAMVALLYSTSRKRDRWHLAAGTLLCGIGAAAFGYANYLIVSTGSPGPYGSTVVLGLAGARIFVKGREVRRGAQLCLSRLRRYREEHGLLNSGEAPGEPRSGPRAGPFGKVSLAGAVVCLVGWESLCVAVLGLHDLLTTGDNPWWAPLAVAALVAMGIALVSMGNAILRTGVQYFDKVIASPDDLTPGRYVLYLRSFQDDRRLSRPHRLPLIGGWLTGAIALGEGEEERIRAALSWAGPLVGVGTPGERVPRAGARRLYLPGDDWQDPVRTLMRGATLVVIMLGTGQGTLWEIREAMRILPPERLLLLVPMKESRYEEFRTLVSGLLPVALPAYERSRALTSRVRGVIHFGPGWEAEFAPLRRPSPLEDQLIGSLDRALWPAMVRLTEHESRAGGTESR